VLDELSDASTNRELVAGLCASYPQLTSSAKPGLLPSGAEKLTGKPLDRLIRRYADRWSLDLAATTPKFAERAALVDLKYWVYEYYDGGSKALTLECWRELIHRKVRDNPRLQAGSTSVNLEQFFRTFIKVLDPKTTTLLWSGMTPKTTTLLWSGMTYSGSATRRSHRTRCIYEFDHTKPRSSLNSTGTVPLYHGSALFLEAGSGSALE
jgi:hypothetical protein